MPSHGNFSKGDFDRAMSRLFDKERIKVIDHDRHSEIVEM